MPRKKIDIFDGRKFGRLTPLLVPMARVITKNGEKVTIVACSCDCGAFSTPKRSNLVSGNTLSCGCGEAYARTQNRRLHGMTDTPEHIVWMRMIDRCANPKNNRYYAYGARGITVCAAWVRSFQVFYDSVGPRPSSEHSLDRVNNDGSYEHGNVRWATRIEQANNKRTNVFLTLNGDTMTHAQWSRRMGVDRRIIESRVKAGWSVAATLLAPVRKIATNKISFYGSEFYGAEWDRILNFSKGTICRRVKDGWSTRQALTTPLVTRRAL